MTASDAMLLPPIGEENAEFWAGARRGELRVQRCPQTQRLLFPPRLRSPYSDRQVPEWTTVSGRGRIWSFVIPHPPLLPQFSEVAPYNVVLVSLEEDERIRMVGNLVTSAEAALDSIDPASIEIGAPVQVVFQPASAEIYMPRWIRV
jgi:uncharacterized OB-fold protein